MTLVCPVDEAGPGEHLRERLDASNLQPHVAPNLAVQELAYVVMEPMRLDFDGKKFYEMLLPPQKTAFACSCSWRIGIRLDMLFVVLVKSGS
jgi:hypothetical protein